MRKNLKRNKYFSKRLYYALLKTIQLVAKKSLCRSTKELWYFKKIYNMLDIINTFLSEKEKKTIYESFNQIRKINYTVNIKCEVI